MPTLPISNLAFTLAESEFHAFAATIVYSTDPVTINQVTFNQAVSHVHWVDAMNKELDALELNNTSIITKLPFGRKKKRQLVVNGY